MIRARTVLRLGILLGVFLVLIAGAAAALYFLPGPDSRFQKYRDTSIKWAKITLNRFGLPSGPRPCSYGTGAQDCPPDSVCAFVREGYAECVQRGLTATPYVLFPFKPDHGVVCTQGPSVRLEQAPQLQKELSSAPPHGQDHSYASTLYAIDLASPPDSPPGEIYSALEGTALVYRSCADGREDDDKNDDPCGNGLGNHIRVLNPSKGLMITYAHLGAVWIQDGQAIRAGEAIGREGQSGRAGHQHLHFSVHAIPTDNWLETVYHYRSHPGLLPPSIPFELQYCDPDHQDECLRKRTRVEKLPCLQHSQPLMPDQIKGPLLRADMRPN